MPILHPEFVAPRMEKGKVMYTNPVIEKVGSAHRLIQTKSMGSGDGTVACFSHPQLSPAIEEVGRASELVQANILGSGDGQPAGHSKIQLIPMLED